MELSRENIEDIYRLTPLQEGMVFQAMAGAPPEEYLEQIRLRLEGPLDPALMSRAWETVVRRNPALRTVFIAEKARQPLQAVQKEAETAFSWEDLRPLGLSKADERVKTFLAEDLKAPFDLARGPLARIKLFTTGAKSHCLVLSFHHAICDGWSLGVLLREFFGLYAGLVDGRGESLEPAVPFSRYIKWLDQQDAGLATSFFAELLEGYEPRETLPGVPLARRGKTYSRGDAKLSLSPELTASLSETAATLGVTLGALLHAAWGVLLTRYTDADDVVFGSVVSGRPEELPGVDRLVGLLINTVPLRLTLSGRETLGEVARKIHAQMLSSAPHHHCPLTGITAALNRGTLVDHAIAVENLPFDGLENADYGGLRIVEAKAVEQGNFDLGVIITPGEHLSFEFHFNLETYTQPVMQRLCGHLEAVLRGFATAPNLSAAALEILSEEERALILEGFSGKKVHLPEDLTAVHLLFERVKAAPHAPAVIADGRALTFEEVNRRANGLAAHLLSLGLKPGELVAIMADRSESWLIALYGVLKAGAAYLPLSTELPDERNRFMAGDAGVRFAIAGGEWEGRLGCAVLQGECGEYISGGDVWRLPAPGQLAYAIYTSGSTGVPKGALIEHRGILNTAGTLMRLANLGGEDRMLLASSPIFDASLLELFTAFAAGMALVVVTKETLGDRDRFAGHLEENRCTAAVLSPAYLRFLDRPSLSPLKALVVGGDVFEPDDALDLASRMITLNGYGPTEASVAVAFHRVDPARDGGGPIPVGLPVENTAIRILDRFDRPVPIGVTGELCAAGPGVARGYLGRPELTAQRFGVDPFGTGQPFYRTGDLARWREDGVIEFFGRRDYQVKIRGVRVELGEVEACLGRCEGVRQATVVHHRENGEDSLYAFVVPKPGFEPVLTEAALRRQLAGALPEAFIPERFTVVERIPLTPAGKVNRKALPKPLKTSLTGTGSAGGDPLLSELSLLWGEILGRENPSPEDDFFAVGGHSLKAMRLKAAIYRKFGVSLELRTIFSAPRLGELAEAVRWADPARFLPLEEFSAAAPVPASYSQKRLWVLHRLADSLFAYNISGAVILHGQVDPVKLAAAVRAAAGRHEALNTVFTQRGDEVFQEIKPLGEEAVEVVDFRGEADPMAKALETAETEGLKVFDLENGPLFRAKVALLEPGTALLTLTLHHIVGDGLSFPLLFSDIDAAYRGEPLPPAVPGFRSYAHWQRRLLADGGAKSHREYWHTRFSGEIPVLNLPADRPRPRVQSFEGMSRTFVFSEEKCRRLEDFARKEKVSLFTLLLALVGALLHRHSGQEDFILGTPAAGRTHPATEKMVGYFVNMLPLRLTPSGEAGFRDFLRETARTALDAEAHQDYPFDLLVEELSPARDPGRSPLFDVVISLEEEMGLPPAICGAKPRELAIDKRSAKYDLGFLFRRDSGAISLELEFSTALFDEDRIARMGRQLETLCDALLKKPDATLSTARLLPEDELQSVITAFNDTLRPYPRNSNLAEAFHLAAMKNPDAAAVEEEGARLSYQELDNQSNRVARWLLTHLRVEPEEPVALLMPKGVRWLVLVLAVLKSGAACLPLDPRAPTARNRQIVAASGARVVLTDGAAGASALGIPAVDAESAETRELLAAEDSAPLPSRRSARSLASIIYTSGSTGAPKGNLVEDRGLLRLALGIDYTTLGPGTKTLSTSSVAFDAISYEVWSALLNGGTLVFADFSEGIDPAAFGHELRHWKITDVFLTTALFNMLTDADRQLNLGLFSGLKTLITGGERASARHFCLIAKRYPGLNLLHAYGPTENSTFSTIHRVSGKVSGEVPIGSAVPNSRAYVLDAKRNPQPIGVAGELCLAGDGLVRGYLGDPEGTARRFVDDPFHPGERMYLSGDLAAWNKDGHLVFLGRNDDQVKIRGFRVEPGEVREALLSLPGVSEAEVSVVDPGESSPLQLCAYLVAAPGTTPQASSLKEGLAALLPPYMIPSHFEFLPFLPLNANGKVDRAALPKPVFTAYLPADAPPSNDAERAVAKAFAETLGVVQVGMNDNFFTLGGDSIRAIRLATLLAGEGLSIKVSDVFSHPTPGGLAAVATRLDGSLQAEKVLPGPVPLSPIQKWFFETFRNAPEHFHQSVVLELSTEALENLEEAVRATVEAHPMLKARFSSEGGAISQFIPAQSEAASTLAVFDLTSEANPEEAFLAASKRVRIELNPFRGPAISWALFKLPGAYRLLIAAHHLVIDGVSWRVLLEDLAAALSKGKPPPNAGDAPYGKWSQALLKAAAGLPEEELEHWLKTVNAPVSTLSAVFSPGPTGTMGETHSFSLDFGGERTAMLLGEANQAYRTEPQHLLLTACARVLSSAGNAPFRLTLESHGRAETLTGLTVNRTVGWFTARYPLLLDLPDSGPGPQLVSVKEAVRSVPNSGAGFLPGSQSGAIPKTPGGEPPVVFNYLGIMDSHAGNAPFRVVADGDPFDLSPATEREQALDLSFVVLEGALSGLAVWDGRFKYPGGGEGFLKAAARELDLLMAHCLETGESVLTPSDTDFKGLDAKGLDDFLDGLEIEL